MLSGTPVLIFALFMPRGIFALNSPSASIFVVGNSRLNCEWQFPQKNASGQISLTRRLDSQLKRKCVRSRCCSNCGGDFSFPNQSVQPAHTPSQPAPVDHSLSDFLIVAIPCARAPHQLLFRATSALKNSGPAAISPATRGRYGAWVGVLARTVLAPHKDPRMVERRPVRAA